MPGSPRADGPVPCGARRAGGGCETTARARGRRRLRRIAASSCGCPYVEDVTLELRRAMVGRVLRQHALAGTAADRTALALVDAGERLQHGGRISGEEDLLVGCEERLEARPHVGD